MGRKKTEHTKKPAKDALQTIQEAQEQPQAAQTDQEPMQTAQETQEQSQTIGRVLTWRIRHRPESPGTSWQSMLKAA